MKFGVAEGLLRLPRATKRMVAIAVDLLICSWTAWAALYLRLEEWVPLANTYGLTVIASVALALPIFVRFGLYRTIFRRAGWPAMLSVFRACLVYGAIYAIIFTFISIPGVPRTVGLIQPVLLFLAISASRGFAHYLLGGGYRRILEDEDATRMLIYGSGQSGRQLLDAVDGRSGFKVVGFLDDDRSLHGGWVQGLPVYDPASAEQVIAGLNVSDVMLALPSSSRRRRRQIVELLLPTGVRVRILPGLADIAKGDVQISELRPIGIEDLLGREPVPPNQSLLGTKIANRVVLVTGGGGSIGSELCRQIVDLGPKTLLIADWSEFALYSIHRELEERCRVADHAAVQIVPLMASVQDRHRIRTILDAWRPDTIYHAAAYKHVPLVEANPLEALKNNVFGTLELVRAAVDFRVSDMVLISTDKAVRPTNVMGASKRLAELVLQAFASRRKETCFSMVRFGNVLGSSGSVVPLFRQQIASGGPVTITHRDVTRYFMTISEASQLVIQAGAMATGGDVFVLDMGEPVRIRDLAVSMIELSGLRLRDSDHPYGDIEIVEVGLRPGEKLYEELLIGEDPIPTSHERIMRAREKMLPFEDLEAALAGLSAALAAGDATQALAVLRELVPEYRRPDEVNERAVEQRNPFRNAGALPTAKQTELPGAA